MASVAAGEEQHHAPVDAMRRLYRERSAAPSPTASAPGADPLTEPALLYQRDSDLVYGAADMAFRFLLERYGDDGVRHLIARMGEGHAFDEAFHDAIGIPLREFESDFRRYVVWGSSRS